ncbi:MAG: diaminopimelate decarboxylase, partial [Cryptosporangiaceae bacterium]|nr:diaminopimelate decarboxylase [Cryptosporangiaceae bacterium]
ARGYAAAFAGSDVFYAGKAFLSKAVARWVAEEGLGLDVCTGGELAVALAAGFPPDRLALHGNNKSTAVAALAEQLRFDQQREDRGRQRGRPPVRLGDRPGLRRCHARACHHRPGTLRGGRPSR